MDRLSAPLRAVPSGILVLGLLALSPGAASAQFVSRIDASLLAQVMPDAARFGRAGGDPPVVQAFGPPENGVEPLVGYVFLTSDLPPEQFGYSGPIEALVGMRVDGRLTGVRVIDYRESYMESMGDFLREPGMQEQFAGKHIGDPFRVWGDVDGISRVTISVRALSRGVRDAARRVANAYGLAPNLEALGGDDVDPVGLSWFELRQLGVVERFEVTEPGEGSAGIALALIENERLGRYFLGEPLYERALGSVERRGGADHLMLYAIDGSRLRLFRQQGWSIVQDGDTLVVEPSGIVSLGLPSGGVVAGEATLVGLMLISGPLEIARPFEIAYDLGDLGRTTVAYVSREAARTRAEEEAAAEAARRAEEEAARRAAEEVERRAAEEAERSAADEAERRPADEEGAAALETAGAAGVGAEPVDSAVADTPPGVRADPPEPVDLFEVTEQETVLARTLASTSWGRVATIVLVLSLATAAFVTKTRAVEWTALLVTLVVLGFVDGGFLSVSHITSGIWTGLSAYTRDLPLLLIVVFTVVTTLVWGRIFCGFLCPFGALQDVIDRIVPERWKRPLPPRLHDRAIYAKYGLLAVVVLPALLGSRVSVYQYVEPFGTVFFLSPSLLLWSIAIAFLGAGVFVPRFYCRYACPLGASLALLAWFAPRRIARVPQCDVCKVCEHACPTGAIRGPVIDFPECVRCNVCEVKLIQRAGVCRHSMEDVRARLVPLEDRRVGKGADA